MWALVNIFKGFQIFCRNIPAYETFSCLIKKYISSFGRFWCNHLSHTKYGQWQNWNPQPNSTPTKSEICDVFNGKSTVWSLSLWSVLKFFQLDHDLQVQYNFINPKFSRQSMNLLIRLDSDFVRPYAWVQPKNVVPIQPPTVLHLHNLSYPMPTGKTGQKQQPISSNLTIYPNLFY